MDKGWIKLHRKMRENAFLMRDNNAYIVFTKLLMMVGQEKGEWAGGRLRLAEEVNLNPNTVKDVVKRLVDNGMIGVDSRGRYSVYSIKNWHIYQNKPNGGQKRRTPDKTPLGKQGSFEDLTPGYTPPRHHRDTTATPLIKEIEEEKELKGSDLGTKKKGQRASPETVKKAREVLMAKLEAKKGQK